MVQNRSAIVIGAGIVGLATARALSLKGFQVTIVERTDKAVGASIRNFGMLWPIGQPAGALYNRAMRSQVIWKEIADSIGLWYDECGSLHTAYHKDEWEVINELYEQFREEGRPVALMDKRQVLDRFNGVNDHHLIGGLYSDTETIVDPRDAIAKTAMYLEEYLGVEFIWGKAVNQVETGTVWIGSEPLNADIVCVCSGADFETLFPEIFSTLEITKCKLQMMRFAPTHKDWRIGTSLCGGLSLIHYSSFKDAASLHKLKERYEQEMAEYLQWGIHVMVSQNDKGELTVGDSHEYGLTFEPFDRNDINQLIKKYLNSFCEANDWEPTQTWNGIYPKLTSGEAGTFLNPLADVYIVNGMGGAGMTMSFGFAEECIDTIA